MLKQINNNNIKCTDVALCLFYVKISYFKLAIAVFF